MALLKLILFLGTISVVQNTESYKILGIFPHTGKSHHMMIEPLLRSLAEKGHEVTSISHYPMSDPPENYRDLSLAGSRHLNLHICDFEDFLGLGTLLRHAAATYELFDLANLNCMAMTEHQSVKKLMKSNETFDLIITEQFNSDCSFGIVNKFKVPTIGIATHVPMPWTMHRFGIPQNPSLIPNHFLRHSRNPSIMEAVESFLVNAYYKMVFYISTHFLEYRFLGNGYLKSRQELDEVAKNLSLLFVTTYFPLHGSFPVGPNIIEIGGVHLPNKLKPLDSDLQKFLDEANDGVIYFSMGSMIRGKSLPKQQLEAFQKAFSKLPYKVLWKWENETMPEKPNNINIRQWMPQYEVLSHRNVKAFISHGGLLGLTEAVNLGVPVMIIPFFGDQFLNGIAAQESGLGKVLQFEDITEETVSENLKQLLSPEMQSNAKRLSEIWKHRPQSALDTAVFWVEHVAKYGGQHLRPSSADLPLYRHWMLDVIFVLTVFAILVSYVSFRTVKYFLKSKSKKSKSD